MTVPEIESSFNIIIVAGMLLLLLLPFHFPCLVPLLATFSSSRLSTVPRLANLPASPKFFNHTGSETTATLLSRALYHLATHPHPLRVLLSELHTAFPPGSFVTFSAVQNLPYLNAVLEESLRIYPPSAFPQARVVPLEGAVVCGEVLPPGTSVGVATLAAATSARNFRRAGEFKPERWLDAGEEGKEWDGDDRKAMQPFLVGPRSCIGRK